MKKRLTVLVFTLFGWVGAVAAPSVSAETRQLEAGQGQLKAERAEVRADRQAWLGERCSQLETRLQTATARFENNRARHVQQYQAMRNRIQSIITVAQKQGLDVTKLQEDGVIFDNRVRKFGSDYVAWMEQLKLAQTHSCGESQGEFKMAMEKARQLAKVVQADVLELRNYYQVVIRPDIQALKAQK